MFQGVITFLFGVRNKALEDHYLMPVEEQAHDLLERMREGRKELEARAAERVRLRL